jgi:hypothetical protein
MSIDIAFARQAEESRVKVLDQLRDLLTAAEKQDLDRDDFHRLFVTAVHLLELDQDTTAGIVRASRPTVSRWMSGAAAPARVGRASVFRELRKVASDKLKQHNSAPAELVCA